MTDRAMEQTGGQPEAALGALSDDQLGQLGRTAVSGIEKSDVPEAPPEKPFVRYFFIGKTSEKTAGEVVVILQELALPPIHPDQLILLPEEPQAA